MPQIRHAVNEVDRHTFDRVAGDLQDAVKLLRAADAPSDYDERMAAPRLLADDQLAELQLQLAALPSNEIRSRLLDGIVAQRETMFAFGMSQPK